MAAEKMKVHAAEQPPEEEEEDLVDPMDEIREKCVEKHCSNFLEKLNECNDRVRSRKKTAESCAEELVDLLHCRDHCAYKEIFKNVK
ncbi:cytochrome b-c1 complex subunit 6 [Trichonephila clavipes]|nr:cytochrome b-c1 complex subunit 6 [Trichonephila clavipes]